MPDGDYQDVSKKWEWRITIIELSNYSPIFWNSDVIMIIIIIKGFGIDFISSCFNVTYNIIYCTINGCKKLIKFFVLRLSIVVSVDN